MKLLLDQNLPRSVLYALTEFPESKHVGQLGLETASDEEIWTIASQQGFVIVTKDRDFADMAVIAGPPKVVWLRVGNCTVALVRQLVTDNIAAILEFSESPGPTLLVIPPGIWH